MAIAYFNSDLIKFVPNIETQDGWLQNGLHKYNIIQFNDCNNNLVSFIEVADNWKGDCTQLFDSYEEANNFIESIYEPVYTIANDALMNANIMQKISRNQLDLEAMDVKLSNKDELKFLYEKGISGIEKSATMLFDVNTGRPFRKVK